MNEILKGSQTGEVLVNITDPSRVVQEGDIMYEGEYLLISFLCENMQDNVIGHKEYNIFLDGALLSTL